MNGSSYIEGGIYNTTCKFSSIESFLEKINIHFLKLPFHKPEVLSRLDTLIKELDSRHSKIGQEEALKLLISMDLKKIQKTLIKKQIENPLVELEKHFSRFIRIFDEFEIDTCDVQFSIVNKFPKPFNNMSWEAFNADKADESKYGIPFGIYFRDDGLAPYYSTWLLAHELTHVSIGLPNPYKLARGLEEGVCDLFGATYLILREYGMDLSKNLIIYCRLGGHKSQFWDIYLDNLRMANYIYRKYGLDGIVELIRSGRDKIKETEKNLLRGRFDKIRLTEGEGNDELTKILDFTLECYQRNYVVSPLAKYIAAHLAPGNDLNTVIEDLNLEKKAGRKAIQELQDKVFLILIDNEKVDYSDMDIFYNDLMLRYEVAKTRESNG